MTIIVRSLKIQNTKFQIYKLKKELIFGKKIIIRFVNVEADLWFMHSNKSHGKIILWVPQSVEPRVMH
jgi:hypothetical protein